MAKVLKNNRAESLNCLYHHGLNLALIMKEAKRWPTDGWMLAGQCIVSFFLTFCFFFFFLFSMIFQRFGCNLRVRETPIHRPSE